MEKNLPVALSEVQEFCAWTGLRVEALDGSDHGIYIDENEAGTIFWGHRADGRVPPGLLQQLLSAPYLLLARPDGRKQAVTFSELLERIKLAHALVRLQGLEPWDPRLILESG